MSNKPLVLPSAGEKISDSDFVRLVNRAQAIVLYLQTLDIPETVKDKLYTSNQDMIAAMNRKIQR